MRRSVVLIASFAGKVPVVGSGNVATPIKLEFQLHPGWMRWVQRALNPNGQSAASPSRMIPRAINALSFTNRFSRECCSRALLASGLSQAGGLLLGFVDSYGVVLPDQRHRAVGKETGETAHVERFNNTLRQRCANLVRKTLSFSKDQALHQARIRLFIDHYNQQLERFGSLASV